MRKLIIMDIAGLLLSLFIMYEAIISIIIIGKVQDFWLLSGFIVFLITTNNISQSDVHHKKPVLMRRLASGTAYLFAIVYFGTWAINTMMPIKDSDGLLGLFISFCIGIIVAFATFFNRTKE